MEREIGEHQGVKIIERSEDGAMVVCLEGDDAGIPFEERQGRVYSPLFPYQSFESSLDLAKRAVEQGFRNKRRQKRKP